MERPYCSNLPASALSAIQRGVMRSVYRGVPLYKSPFDLALYLQLFSKLGPRTVIEIGTKHGGSALWFADTLSAHKAATPRVISVDIKSNASIDDDRIAFIRGDALDLGSALQPELLFSCARPWLVVEDSAHHYETSIATLKFFDRFLEAKDYIVVEDGAIAQLPQPKYKKFQDGPNRAVAEFLGAHSDRYEVDTGLCDHFGFNVTYNPNAWLRRL